MSAAIFHRPHHCAGRLWICANSRKGLDHYRHGVRTLPLQRQICTQALPPKRGRRAEELIATSGALHTRHQLCDGVEHATTAPRSTAKLSAPRCAIASMRSNALIRSDTGTSTSAAPSDSPSTAMPNALSPQLLNHAHAAPQKRNRDFLHERYATPMCFDRFPRGSAGGILQVLVC
jgi:hypothetical protein